jgi:hypothetical protein
MTNKDIGIHQSGNVKKIKPDAKTKSAIEIGVVKRVTHSSAHPKIK